MIDLDRPIIYDPCLHKMNVICVHYSEESIETASTKMRAAIENLFKNLEDNILRV
jgi:hypothetical protein